MPNPCLIAPRRACCCFCCRRVAGSRSNPFSTWAIISKHIIDAEIDAPVHKGALKDLQKSIDDLAMEVSWAFPLPRDSPAADRAR